MESEARSSAAGQLTILLEEYRSLRAEVNQRIATNGSLVGLAAAGIAIFATADPGPVVWVVAMTVAFLLAAVWVSNLLGLRALGGHLRTLEQRINGLAAGAYPDADLESVSPLLGWETWRNGPGAGWLRRLGARFGV